MRPSDCKITPAVVRAEVRAALQQALPVRPYDRFVCARALLDLLLLVAATASSLYACVRRFVFGFSHETAGQTVTANRPGHASWPPAWWEPCASYFPSPAATAGEQRWARSS